MIIIQKLYYRCEKCGSEYDKRKDAAICGRKKVTKDRGLKIGDKVKVLNGDGAGKVATIESIYTLTKDWGHHAWKRYWHTIAVSAKLDESWGSRFLTFDDYELINN